MSDTQTFKVVVYVPTSHTKELINALSIYGVNRIGEYTNCISYSQVTSTWTPTENAKPFIGFIGEPSNEQEHRIEFLCQQEKLQEVAKVIRGVHPYEEVEIDAYLILTI